MIKMNESLYNVKEILQEHVTDFDIMREKPLSFTAGGRHIVCLPVRYYEHGQFVRDLSRLLTSYYRIFQKVEFLSAQNCLDTGAVNSAINQITIFDNTVEYRKFITKEIPAFVRRYCRTIRGEKLVKIHRVKSLIKHFSADELLQVFFTVFVFNYDIVKKKTFDFLTRLQTGRPANSIYSGSFTRANTALMPKYSERPFSRSDLQSLEEQSRLN